MNERSRCHRRGCKRLRTQPLSPFGMVMGYRCVSTAARLGFGRMEQELREESVHADLGYQVFYLPESLSVAGVRGTLKDMQYFFLQMECGLCWVEIEA